MTSTLSSLVHRERQIEVVRLLRRLRELPSRRGRRAGAPLARKRLFEPDCPRATKGNYVGIGGSSAIGWGALRGGRRVPGSRRSGYSAAGRVRTSPSRLQPASPSRTWSMEGGSEASS